MKLGLQKQYQSDSIGTCLTFLVKQLGTYNRYPSRVVTPANGIFNITFKKPYLPNVGCHFVRKVGLPSRR